MSGERRPVQPQARPGMGFGRPGMGGPAEKPKDFRGTLRSLFRYLRPFHRTVAAALLLAAASTGFAIAGPKLLGQATNTIVTGYVQKQVYDQVMAQLPPGTALPPGTTGATVLERMPSDVLQKIPATERDAIRAMDFSRRPGIDFARIARLALLLAGLYLAGTLCGYLQGWIMAGVAQNVALTLRRDISLKIGRLPLRYFDARPHGDVLSRVTNDVDTVSQTLNQSLAQAVTALATIAGILIMMLTISWRMTLAALLVLPLSFAVVGQVVGRSQRFFMQQQAALGRINGHIEEMFSGHTVMKAFNGEARSLAAFSAGNDELYASAWKAQFLSGILMPVMMFVGNLGYVAVAVLGGWLAVRGSVTIGDIQAFIQYMGQFNQPITQAATVANVLQSTAAAAERVFEFLAEPEETPDPAAPATLDRVRGAVEFRNVSFGYEADRPVIKGLTASVRPGQRVAIVGPTGAGKTTLVNLLMRFYEVDGGAITVDGVDVRDLRRPQLRKLFGMVLQDAWLFSGSIEENVAYGRPGATHAQVEAAAAAAHADHFIKALPGGYGLELNEEADNISQGEKQLLTIARAMLADAPMLILDEATSSVDTRTESLIQAAMERLMQGRTCFVIAHRLSTIRDADLILVMRDGSVVEQGTHRQLLERGGFYASLYQSQFEEG